jgi:hypothetical protein
MPEETILPGADVTDIPAPAAEASADTASQPEPPAPAVEPEPAVEQKDFASLFSETVAKVTADLDDSEEDKPAAPAPAEDDDTIPSDEADEDKPAEPSEPADDKAKKQPDGRTRKYKEVVEQNEQLQQQISRVDALEQQFEKHGGLDVVETAMQMFEKLSTKPAEILAELPKHQREQMVRDVFAEALTNENNRVYGVNSVLRQEFGLSNDLTQQQMEKVFEFVAHRLNDDPTDFEAFLDRELEFANTPEREAARLRAENERLKSQPAAAEAPQETPQEFAERMNGEFETFEDSVFTDQVMPKFETYGLNVLPTDPAEVRESKEILQAAARSLICEQMRTAKAFDPLIPYMVSGDTKNQFFDQAKGAYGRAMKARAETLLKAVSRLLGKAQAQPAVPAGGEQPAPQQRAQRGVQIPAPGGKSQLPAPAKKAPEGGGFGNAFSIARKNAGTA